MPISHPATSRCDKKVINIKHYLSVYISLTAYIEREYFFCFFTFIFVLFLPCPFLSSPLLSFLSLFCLSLGDDTKWLTRVHVSFNLNTITEYTHNWVLCVSFLTACQWYQWWNSLGNSASENTVDTISECSDQNVQLRRLTRVFARRTGRIGKPGDYRSQMRLVKALIRLLMCRLIRLIVPVFVGFVMHTHMRIVCANLDGKIFNRWHFSHFSKETDLAFHANCLHSTEWHIQFSNFPGNKKK